MILGDLSLWKLLNELIRDPDPDLVNPASIDVRVGPDMCLEVGPDECKAVDLTAGRCTSGRVTSPWSDARVADGAERLAVELRSRASHAQQGTARSDGRLARSRLVRGREPADPQRHPPHSAADRARDAHRPDRRPRTRPARGAPHRRRNPDWSTAEHAKAGASTIGGPLDDGHGDCVGTARLRPQPLSRLPPAGVGDLRGSRPRPIQADPGAKNPVVCVDDECVEVLAALQTRTADYGLGDVGLPIPISTPADPTSRASTPPGSSSNPRPSRPGLACPLLREGPRFRNIRTRTSSGRRPRSPSAWRCPYPCRASTRSCRPHESSPSSSRTLAGCARSPPTCRRCS